jgi:hypothetical protein
LGDFRAREISLVKGFGRMFLESSSYSNESNEDRGIPHRDGFLRV